MKDILLVDGYNVIGSWLEAEKMKWPIDECRDRLTDMLEEYGSLINSYIILVFDGYKSDKLFASIEKRNNMDIVFTKKDETADHYIEKTVYSSPKYHRISVATSDALQQSTVLGNGAIRISSRELLQRLKEELSKSRTDNRNMSLVRDNIASRLSSEQYEILEKIRRSNE